MFSMHMSLSLYVSCLLTIGNTHDAHQRVHECSHNHLHSDTDTDVDIHEAFVRYEHHPFDRPQRRLSTTDDIDIDIQPQPIRINAYYDPRTLSTSSTTSDVSSEQIDDIKTLISTVIRFLHQSISVIPVSSPLLLPRVCTWQFDTEFGPNCVEYLAPNQCGMVDVPPAHMAQDWLYFTNTTQARKLPQGPGIGDTDLVLYVSFADTASCGESTLAWAHPCYQDQHGRPVAGNVNICPFMFESPQFWKQDVVVLLHEILHVLIMGPEIWDDFRDVDGQLVPMEQVVSERQSDGLRYVMTPNVAELARRHFGCSELIGFPLEDTGDAGQAGSHWDERYAMSALMGSTIWGGLQYLTAFTMALMQDSGWYYVDYSYAEPYHFGQNTGCDFFNLPCIDAESGTSNWPQFWCVSPSDNGCNHNYIAPAFCEFYVYDDELPKPVRYFGDATFGGPAASEFCPFRDASTDAHVLDFESACLDVRGNDPQLVRKTFASEWYGPQSRCVDVDDGRRFKGYCFQHECVGYDAGAKLWNAVHIHVDDIDSIECSREDGPDGAYMTRRYSRALDAYISCPNIDAICGESSRPFECVWGHYSDSLQRCVCAAGYVGEHCEVEDRNIDFELNQTMALDVEMHVDVGVEEEVPISDFLCVSNFSQSWLNGEYRLDGVWNFYPRWKNDENGVFVFWNSYRHWWMMFSEFDAMHYYAYCNESRFTPDIEGCNSLWRVFRHDLEAAVLEQEASVHYGECTRAASDENFEIVNEVELFSSTLSETEDKDEVQNVYHVFMDDFDRSSWRIAVVAALCACVVFAVKVVCCRSVCKMIRSNWPQHKSETDLHHLSAILGGGQHSILQSEDERGLETVTECDFDT